jgi:hypothetical protein
MKTEDSLNPSSAVMSSMLVRIVCVQGLAREAGIALEEENQGQSQSQSQRSEKATGTIEHLTIGSDKKQFYAPQIPSLRPIPIQSVCASGEHLRLLNL